jgi:hypothetical protein
MDQENQPDTSHEESSPVQPLQTFQTDIEKVLRTKELSKKDLATAEALRTKKEDLTPAPSLKPLTPPPVPPVVEPKSVVLPPKEIHSPLNAVRVSADKLVAQEEQAQLPKVQAPPMPALKPQPAVPPIETFKTAVAEYVRDNKVSTVQVAAAEEARRAQEEKPVVVQRGTSVGTRVALMVVGLLLIAGAGGALTYTYYTQRTLPAAENPTAPFIAVDETVPVILTPNEASGDILQALTSAKNNVKLSLGLVAQLQPSTGTTSIGAQTFFCGSSTTHARIFIARTGEPISHGRTLI